MSNIKKFREERNLSQSELGKQIGRKQSAISNIECNPDSLSVKNAKKLADFFNKSICEICESNCKKFYRDCESLSYFEQRKLEIEMLNNNLEIAKSLPDKELAYLNNIIEGFLMGVYGPDKNKRFVYRGRRKYLK